ncbi:MAG: gliding motility-associated C-terminal domain-containing protein, partial [Flavobacteriales bacterium]|nr:gliding motility-associated C-terminal domain-containing protein [Flavobacteriales bacterium]
LGVLPDGTYTYVLTVADGVCTSTDTVVITILPTPIADAGPNRSIYLQGTTVLGGSPSGPPGSSFTWQPDSLLDHADIPDPTATLDVTTWFHLTVIGPDGCVGIDSVLVTVVPEVKVPSGFTPNGDGHNDTWILDFASLFPGIEVQVFSRWGEPLFRSVGYAVPWDGKYDGKIVPMGTYYYVVELHDDRFPEALTGPLTVIR